MFFLIFVIPQSPPHFLLLPFISQCFFTFSFFTIHKKNDLRICHYCYSQNMNIIKQLPDDLQDMIYSQLHKSYMKDVNIEIEQYEEKQMEKQRREDRRWVLFNRIALLYKRSLRKIYTDKIKFLDGYHEHYLLERKIRHIYEEKGKRQHHYNVIDLVLEEIISADDI